MLGIYDVLLRNALALGLDWVVLRRARSMRKASDAAADPDFVEPELRRLFSYAYRFSPQ